MQREQLPFALLPFLTFVIGGDKTDGKNQEGELIMLAFTAEIIGLTIYVARKKRIEEDKKSETEDHGRVGKEECSTGILHGK